MTEKKEVNKSKRSLIIGGAFGGIYAIIASYLYTSDIYYSTYFGGFINSLFSPSIVILLTLETLALNIYEKTPIILLVILLVSFFMALGIFLGWSIKNFRKLLENACAKYIIILIIIFIFLLSILGIPPFGTYKQVGDVILPRPTFLITVFFFPLIFLAKLIFSLGFELSIRKQPIILLFILLIIFAYSYLISIIILYIYNKLKQRKIYKNKFRFIFITLLFVVILVLNPVYASTDNNVSNNGLIEQVNVKDIKELLINFIPVNFGYNYTLLNHKIKDKAKEK